MSNPEELPVWEFSATIEITGDAKIRAKTYDEAMALFENNPSYYLSVEYETVIEIHEGDEDDE